MSKARHSKKRHNLALRKLAVLGVIGVIGAALIHTSRAATYSANAEVEAATRSGNASVVSSSNASKGSAMSFGAAAMSCDQAGIQKLVNNVSRTTIETNLRELVQDNSKPKPNELISRHVSSPGNKIKVDWAKQQLTSYGLQVMNQSFVSDGRTLHNVSGRLAGTNLNALYVTGAHIDSISERSSTLAPGADDDASGVVVMMETARVLKAFQPCLKTTLDFNGYNDEEENMTGSPTYLKSVAGKSVKGAINMDMIGYQPVAECLKSETSANAASRDRPLVQKIVDMNAKYGVGLNVTTGTYTQNAGDDLEVFWKANIPGAYLIECTTEKDTDNYPGYHSTTDTIKYVNTSQLTKTAKLLVAALAELGMQ